MVQSMQVAISNQAKYAKIKTNVKSKSNADDDVIMFKDYRDEEEEIKPQGYQEADMDSDSGYGDEEGEDDYYDEEISAGDIKKKKGK